jgi:hypothetical protein
VLKILDVSLDSETEHGLALNVRTPRPVLGRGDELVIPCRELPIDSGSAALDPADKRF